jgi:hypothetical protein
MRQLTTVRENKRKTYRFTHVLRPHVRRCLRLPFPRRLHQDSPPSLHRQGNLLKHLLPGIHLLLRSQRPIAQLGEARTLLRADGEDDPLLARILIRDVNVSLKTHH